MATSKNDPDQATPCVDCKSLLSGYRTVPQPHPYLVEKSKSGNLTTYRCLICRASLVNETNGIISLWRLAEEERR